MTFWRKYRSLRPQGRRILLRMAVALPLAALAIRVFGFRRVQAALGRRTRPGEAPENALRWVRNMRHINRYLAQHGPYRGNCLSQALLLWWFLRRLGIDSDFRIGVRTEGGQLLAHAWVEYQGHPLNPPEKYRLYQPFDQPVLPRGVPFS